MVRMYAMVRLPNPNPESIIAFLKPLGSFGYRSFSSESDYPLRFRSM